MAQTGITRIGDQYFREYQIEQGDDLWTICMRYGHRDYRVVYNLSPANDAFRSQFPDPHQIDFIFPNLRLHIPLPGAVNSGESYRGKPIEDYIVANVVQADGSPLANTTFFVASSATTAGTQVTTTVNGDILLSNPPDSGLLFLGSNEYMLLDPSKANDPVSPMDVSSEEMSLMPGLYMLAPVVQLPLNSLTRLAARRLRVIVCPMCGQSFRVVQTATSSVPNVCPNDNFDLKPVFEAIQNEQSSFVSVPPQDPGTTPGSLKCRGQADPLTTVYGNVPVYWDESRFVKPDGGNYKMWAKLQDGTTSEVDIVGRSTWSARSPEVTLDNGENPPGPRRYEFQTTNVPNFANYPYNTINIPGNDNTPLKNVFRWITVHHTADPSRSGFAAVSEIQDKHMDEGVGGSLAADIGYHFLIASDGVVYEGRALGIKGSHVGLFNGGNAGIVLAGDFESTVSLDDNNDPVLGDDPTPAAVASLDRLVHIVAARFGINSVCGHRHRDQQRGVPVSTLMPGDREATECPGRRLIPHVENELRSRYPGQGEPTFLTGEFE